MTDHTPTPWTCKGQAIFEESSGHTMFVAYCGTVFGAGVKKGKVESFIIHEDNAHANAAFIVKAVNNHAPMVRSLEQCAQLFDVLATTMERWATESREGGWSTHQVAENRVRAGDCRRYAATIRSALPGAVGSPLTPED